MQMRSGRKTGVTHITEQLIALHELSLLHGVQLHVSVLRHIAVSMIESDIVAKGFAVTRNGDHAICGTRGWFYEEDAAGTHTGKMLAREALRLEASLKAAEGKPIYCFLHYPPIYQGYQCPEMLELLDKYEVERCYYGHLHGYTHRRAFEGMRGKTEYALIAADYVAFQPVKICN